MTPGFLRAVRQYLEMALWSSTGDDGEPLDRTYSTDDFSLQANRQAERELEEFLARVDEANLILSDRWEEREEPGEPERYNDEDLAHDFWLTRNGHGTGFWDRPEKYGEERSKILSEIAHRAGERDAYVGGDGKIYFAPDPGRDLQRSRMTLVKGGLSRMDAAPVSPAGDPEYGRELRRRRIEQGRLVHALIIGEYPKTACAKPNSVWTSYLPGVTCQACLVMVDRMVEAGELTVDEEGYI
jgi:hypothetical protein